MAEYERPFIAVYCFIRDRDMMLMIERANTGFMDGKISVPSGHLDQGETTYAAASREVMEEAGVSVDPASWKTLAVMHRRTATRTYMDFFMEASE